MKVQSFNKIPKIQMKFVKISNPTVNLNFYSKSIEMGQSDNNESCSKCSNLPPGILAIFPKSLNIFLGQIGISVFIGKGLEISKKLLSTQTHPSVHSLPLPCRARLSGPSSPIFGAPMQRAARAPEHDSSTRRDKPVPGWRALPRTRVADRLAFSALSSPLLRPVFARRPCPAYAAS
jgi:hypothetical protein